MVLFGYITSIKIDNRCQKYENVPIQSHVAAVWKIFRTRNFASQLNFLDGMRFWQNMLVLVQLEKNLASGPCKMAKI